MDPDKYLLLCIQCWNSRWGTVDLSETCTVLYENNLRNSVSCWLLLWEYRIDMSVIFLWARVYRRTVYKPPLCWRLPRTAETISCYRNFTHSCTDLCWGCKYFLPFLIAHGELRFSYLLCHVVKYPACLVILSVSNRHKDMPSLGSSVSAYKENLPDPLRKLYKFFLIL
jgi:hypothetical protein